MNHGAVHSEFGTMAAGEMGQSFIPFLTGVSHTWLKRRYGQRGTHWQLAFFEDGMFSLKGSIMVNANVKKEGLKIEQ